MLTSATIVWALSILIFFGGCVTALDLADHRDAVAELCKCDSKVPQYGGKCAAVLSERLNSASPARREAWLGFYSDTCAGRCDNATACYQQPGTCAQVSCSQDEECCGYRSDGSGTSCAGSGEGKTCGAS